MKLTGIHPLLSYRCTDACDHCFLWSSPQARGTMTLAQILDVLRQANALGTVGMVYFEGGEPFLFYPVMIAGLREAAALGIKAGIVTNNYWATSVEDAVEWLRPIAEIGLEDLSLSSDLFHGEAMMMQSAQNAMEAAHRLGLSKGVIAIEAPEGCDAYTQDGKGEPITGGPVRFRGRAVDKLTEGVPRQPWAGFTEVGLGRSWARAARQLVMRTATSEQLRIGILESLTGDGNVGGTLGRENTVRYIM